MNTLKINSINNNLTFRSIKDISKSAKVIKTATTMAMSSITAAGITYSIYKDGGLDANPIKLREQANKYNEKTSRTSDFSEDILNKEVQTTENAEVDTKFEDINSISKKMEEQRLPDFREVKGIDEDFLASLSRIDCNLIDRNDLKKEISIIKNKQLKNIAENICGQNQLSKALVMYMRDIDAGLENITDKRISKYVKDELKKQASLKYEACNYNEGENGEFEYFGALEHIADVVDVYNTLTGKYSRYKEAELMGESLYLDKSKPAKYMRRYRRHTYRGFTNFIKALNMEGRKHPIVSDFEEKQKTEALKTLTRKKEMLDYMYEKYYVRTIPYAKVRKLCREINNKYDVKVLLSNNTFDTERALEVIRDELEAWTQVSEGKVKLPKIIDLNSCDDKYEDADAYVDIRGNIYHKGAKLYSSRALRHEIMHLNEPGRSISIFSSFSSDPEMVKLIRSIMPSIKFKIGGREEEILDYDNCKYREEFLKAGIEPDHIEYAYTNKSEFLAVAAEGDLSQYSPEFREILIKIGMPEYVFDLPIKNFNVKMNVNTMKSILENHPEVTSYDELVELFEEKEQYMDENSPASRLLLSLQKMCEQKKHSDRDIDT